MEEINIKESLCSFEKACNDLIHQQGLIEKLLESVMKEKKYNEEDKSILAKDMDRIRYIVLNISQITSFFEDNLDEYIEALMQKDIEL